MTKNNFRNAESSLTEILEKIDRQVSFDLILYVIMCFCLWLISVILESFFFFVPCVHEISLEFSCRRTFIFREFICRMSEARQEMTGNTPVFLLLSHWLHEMKFLLFIFYHGFFGWAFSGSRSHSSPNRRPRRLQVQCKELVTFWLSWTQKKKIADCFLRSLCPYPKKTAIKSPPLRFPFSPDLFSFTLLSFSRKLSSRCSHSWLLPII